MNAQTGSEVAVLLTIWALCLLAICVAIALVPIKRGYKPENETEAKTDIMSKVDALYKFDVETEKDAVKNLARSNETEGKPRI
jgi:hypothetical protein